MRILKAILALFLFASFAAARERSDFEENRGQFPRDVLFRGRTSAIDVYVHATDLRVALVQHAASGYTRDFVQIVFAEANLTPSVEGVTELPGRTNYFRTDARIEGVRTFARVAIRELYDRIDLDLYTRGGQMEFDFVVRPGGDPAAIRLKTGSDIRTELNGSGHLNEGPARRHDLGVRGFTRRRKRS